MRGLMMTTLLSAIVLLGGKAVHSADEPSQGEELDTFVTAMRPKFARLSQQYAPEFDQLMRALTAGASLTCFFQTDDQPRRARLYREFVVQSLDNSLRGDVGEAMFAALALSVTPPRVVLEAIAPEIGPDGRLHGLVEQPSHDVFERIQGQPSQGYAGPPSFDPYVAYLRDKRGRGVAERPNAELLIAHMFKTDVQEAFVAMLQIDYGFAPESRQAYMLVELASREQVRQLQLLRHEVGDYLFHHRYAFAEPSGLQERVASHLREGSTHTRWWVRLYVAEAMRQHSELREREIVARLVDDDHPLVREAMRFAREAERENGTGPIK